MTQYLPIPVFNEDDEPIGNAPLADVHNRGLLHRVTLVVLKDAKKRILLQHRGPNVATNANRWDVSAAGYVDPGESYDEAAHREVQEEIGVTNVSLNEIAYYRSKQVVERHTLNRFVKIFGAEIAGDTHFTINPEELSEVRWFESADLEKQVRQHPEKFNNDFAEVFGKVRAWL